MLFSEFLTQVTIFVEDNMSHGRRPGELAREIPVEDLFARRYPDHIDFFDATAFRDFFNTQIKTPDEPLEYGTEQADDFQLDNLVLLYLAESQRQSA